MTRSEAADSPSLKEQVAILQEQLAQAQKLTALGELVGTTTHEFNNILMTVINYAKIGMRHKNAGNSGPVPECDTKDHLDRFNIRPIIDQSTRSYRKAAYRGKHLPGTNRLARCR